MHRWFGSSTDSERQAGERAQRAARRQIATLPVVDTISDSEDEYRDCDLSNSFINLNVDGQNDDSVSSEPEVAIMAAFDTENGQDDDEYYKKLSTLKNRIFNKNEVEFWFTSFEASLKHIGIKSQWSKREVLHNLLPDDVQVAVKHILKKDQTAAGATAYKTLKTELLKLYAPKQEAAYTNALSRKLSIAGTPSNLLKQLIDDLCTCQEPLSSKCCQRILWGMWCQELPLVIRQRLAGQEFSDTTYKSMMELADALFETTAAQSAVAAVKSTTTNNLNDTQPAIPYAVNAASQPSARGQGRGRGNRGGRGRGGRGRGGNSANQNNQNQNSSSTSSRWPTQRHADGPPSNACFNHHTYGRAAFHCTDPLSCGWASIPPNPRPKPLEK